MKISVVIPTYNRVHTLLKAVRSVLHQTSKVLEILVCDDGSTDNTRKSILALKSPQIRFLAGSHSGLPAVARNRGILRSRGNWIAFLDSDDLWLPAKIQLQTKFLSLHPEVSLCYTNGLIDNQPLFTGNYPQDNIYSTLLRENFIINSSVLVKKESLLQVGGFSPRKYWQGIEDYELWLRLSRSYKLAGLTNPLVIYNQDRLSDRLSTNPPKIFRSLRRLYFHQLFVSAFSDKQFLINRMLYLTRQIKQYEHLAHR